MGIEAQILSIITHPRVRTIAALILLDVLLGVAESLKSGKFDFGEVGRFYRSMVLPYLVGYVALTFLIPMLTGDLLGEFQSTLNEGLVVIAWLALIAPLGKSVLSHLNGLLSNS